MTLGQRTICLVALSLTVALGAASCGGKSGRSPAGPNAEPTNAVTALPTPGPLSPAVAELLTAVVALRGLPGPTAITATVVSRRDLPTVLDATLTAEDRLWFVRTTRLYRLLGYIGPTEEYLDIYLGFAGKAVAAFYDPATARFWLVSETPGALDSPDAAQRAIIAHELVHALQDASFGLQQTTRSVQNNLDRGLAYTAVVEGDAVSTERLFAIRPGAGGAVLFAASAMAFQGVPPALEREFRFPYTAGAEWIAAIRRAGGNAAVDALLATPPSATALVLHPALALSWAPETVSLPAIEDALGQGWRRDSTGTLGEFHLGNFLQQQLKGLDAVQAAEGWTGDQYDLYTDGNATVAVFRARFRDEEEAVQFARAYSDWLGASGARAVASKSAFALYEFTDGTTHGFTQASGTTFTWVIASQRAGAETATEALTNG